jgi:hypothetical protein
MDELGGRQAGESPDDYYSRVRFLFLRFIRISETQKKLLG